MLLFCQFTSADRLGLRSSANPPQHASVRFSPTYDRRRASDDRDLVFFKENETGGYSISVPNANGYNDLMSRQDPSTLNDIQIGQPAWRMALLFPPQGSWTEQEYLALDAGRQIEFDRGCVEVLDIPTKEHHRLVRFLFLLMQAFVSSRGLGEVFFAPLPVRLWNEKYREPDLVYLASGRSDAGKYPDGADLVVEIVSDSPSDRKRDLEIKVSEYERAGISEYWVVDPQKAIVLVHCLIHSKYAVDSFTTGQIAHSRILDGFSVGVESLFEAAKRT